MNNINPTTTKAWKKLEEQASKLSNSRIADLFDLNVNRVEEHTVNHPGILFDFSKQKLDIEILNLFYELLEEVNLKDGMKRFFAGEKINVNENRAVLHPALRSSTSAKLTIEGENVEELVNKTLKKVEEFANAVHAGKTPGYTDKKITTIVNIGIGGSDLGSKMVVRALEFDHPSLDCHFVSNVDGADLFNVLQKVDHETTLFVVASKTFTTQETMTNAHSAREWLIKESGDINSISKHFIAVSTNVEGCLKFGILEENIFEFWDWVGGRFSVSSAIGIPIALALGMDTFRQFLEGMKDMDQHFTSEKWSNNIPVLMALISIWNVNFLKYNSHAILPYDQRLSYFPAFLQQMIMESNGKSTDRNGNKVEYNTSPIIWGEPGTNGQHSFYQLIHQGTQTIPCDFIGFLSPGHNKKDHHRKLLSHMLAQSEGMMGGKSYEAVAEELKTQNYQDIDSLAPFKVMEGDIPSSVFMLQELTPFSVGQLVAMYEHMVFVMGYIWNIYSFDQWGVELGKKLSVRILEELEQVKPIHSHDPSTAFLIKTINSHTNNE